MWPVALRETLFRFIPGRTVSFYRVQNDLVELLLYRVGADRLDAQDPVLGQHRLHRNQIIRMRQDREKISVKFKII